MSADLIPITTLAERLVLQSALWTERDRVNRQRVITEKRLAFGEGNAATLTRLGYHEERDLAAIDSLLVRIGAA